MSAAAASPRIACGLDIGSNTFSCVELHERDGAFHVALDASHVTRLSEGLAPSGPLAAGAVQRSLLALEEIAKRFDLRGKPLRAVGTACLRMTSDPRPFLEPAHEILGVEVEVISGAEEASLTSRGAGLGLGVPLPHCIVDVGGQSTEICWREDGPGERSVSLDLGVVSLSARFLGADPPVPSEIDALRAHVRETLREAVPPRLPGALVAVAGTATTLGAAHLGLAAWDRSKVHGLDMQRESLIALGAAVMAAPILERAARFHIHPGRADVFPAGIVILEEVLDHLGRGSFVISANGLRVGVARVLLEEQGHGSRT